MNYTDYFVDPRCELSVTKDDKKIRVKIDSQSQFVQALKKHGSLKAWKRAYKLAKKSPVARLIVAAADVNDYPFLIDEKQVADNKIKEQLDSLVYALANGIGRTKLNKDSTLRKTTDWRTIPIMTGETLLLPDNVTGGANTRLLTVAAPCVILDTATCKQIRDIIGDNFGLAFPLVIDKIFLWAKKR